LSDPTNSSPPVTAVAHNTPTKGQFYLIDALCGLPRKHDRVYFVPMPSKIFFLWPSFILAGILAVIIGLTTTPVITHITATENVAKDGDSVEKATSTKVGTIVQYSTTHMHYGQFFMLFLTFNLIMVTFDFPRGTIVTVILGIAALIFALFLLETNFPGFLGPVGKFFTDLKLVATSQFYATFCLVGMFLVFGMFVMMRFNYYEMTNNEMIHHQGLLGDEARFSTAGMKFSKDITDIFEYFVFKSGRLEINLPAAQRTIHLETVTSIDRKMRDADNILRMGRAVVENRENVATDLPVNIVRTNDS
jgi:hypothetical protein